MTSRIDPTYPFVTQFCCLLQGSIKIYKLPLPKDLDDHTVMGFDPQYGFFQVKFVLSYRRLVQPKAKAFVCFRDSLQMIHCTYWSEFT